MKTNITKGNENIYRNLIRYLRKKKEKQNNEKIINEKADCNKYSGK